MPSLIAFFVALWLVFVAVSAQAEISLSTNHLPLAINPNAEYALTQDLGVSAGSNLFHSFHRFNIDQGETVVFSGANHIENVISRVTGGGVSNINGTIKNTIPAANTYLINPAGILFGEQARLDVKGSFYASTADYLAFSAGKFYVDETQGSTFSLSEPQSFGFMDKPHGGIEVKRHGELASADNLPTLIQVDMPLNTGTSSTLAQPMTMSPSTAAITPSPATSLTPVQPIAVAPIPGGVEKTQPSRPLLQVPAGETLSLVGGNIELSQSQHRLTILGLRQPETLQQRNQANVRQSLLYAPSGNINLIAVEGKGHVPLNMAEGLGDVAGATVKLERSAYLASSGESGGNVLIRAADVNLNFSRIETMTMGSQAGGAIDIKAKHITTEGADLLGGTVATGKGSDIFLDATDRIEIAGSRLNNGSGVNNYRQKNLGDGGDIVIKAAHIEIRDQLGGEPTLSHYSTGKGQHGDTRLQASHSLLLDDVSFFIDSSETVSGAGDLLLDAPSIEMRNSSISVDVASADSNQLHIAAERLYIHDGEQGERYASVGVYGENGLLSIETNELVLEDGAALFVSNFKPDSAAGEIRIKAEEVQLRGVGADGESSLIRARGRLNSIDGGTIQIHADNLFLLDGAKIDASTRTSDANKPAGNAGQIELVLKEQLLIQGVNPQGENANGFASAIDASSQGNAGDAGQIEIQAGSLAIRDGGQILTGMTQSAYGGDIDIEASQGIEIQGSQSLPAASEPAPSQAEYLANARPQNYNQATSGIYSHSSNTAPNSGNSGEIRIRSPRLKLSDQAQISTASQGGGDAGQILLDVGELVLSDKARITSNSRLANRQNFASHAERDAQILQPGDMVHIEDIGNGQSAYQINRGDSLLGFMPIIEVESLETLEQLSRQYDMNGKLVRVTGTDNGAANFFVYVDYLQSWMPAEAQASVVLEQPHFNTSTFYFTADYENGTRIHVKDAGNGKSADFIQTRQDYSHYQSASYHRVNQYWVADMNEFQNLSAETELVSGLQVDVGGHTRMVYNGDTWLTLGRAIQVADIAEQQNLTLAHAGQIATLADSESIFTGEEWISLGNSYRVADLAQRDALSVQHGDLVKVANIGNGRHDAFLYANGEWIRQIRGGDAGGIELNVDVLKLSTDAEISTASISGGGGEISINTEGLSLLEDSQISTSVQEGVGNGGNLQIANPEALAILGGSKIIAQAVEGQGGNIHLETANLLQTADILISASSQLGIDGELSIQAQNISVQEALFEQQSQFLQSQLPSCEVGGSLNRFSIQTTPKRSLPFGLH